MTDLYEPPTTRTRVETAGDGMSAAALLTSWVGATFPLLPGVALVIAIAGRKRSATRWLNTLAVIVSAVFLAVQVVIALVFGGVIVRGLDTVLNRDGDMATAASSPFLDNTSGDDLMLPSTDQGVTDPTPAPEDVDPDGDLAVTTTMPGVDTYLDAAYLDTLGSTLEDSGFELSDFDQDFLYAIAGSTCQDMDNGDDLDTVAQTINDQDVPRAIAGTIATVAVVTYCPQHSIDL